MYIYIYIYIVIHRQTVSFYQNTSVWLDTQDARSRDRNTSNFMLDCVSDHSATKRTTLAKGILKYFIFRNSSSVCLHFFNTLSATRVLNSFEELCITLAAYIYIYIYIKRETEKQTDRVGDRQTDSDRYKDRLNGGCKRSSVAIKIFSLDNDSNTKFIEKKYFKE